MNRYSRVVWILFRRYLQSKLLRYAKRRGVITYLHVLQNTRRLMLILVVAFCFLQILILAGMGTVVVGVLLLDYDLQIKLQILFWTFFALCTLPLLVLGTALSERMWYRFSGAKKMVDDIRRQ